MTTPSVCNAPPPEPTVILYPLSILHPQSRSPASRLVTRARRNTRPSLDGPKLGQSRRRQGASGGRRGSGASGAQASPGQLGEGVRAGMRKFRAPRPGGKPRNLSAQLSQEAPQPGPKPDPTRLPGPGSSAVPPPRPPHPSRPSRRQRGFASRGSGAEPERSPHPSKPGRGRAAGPAFGGGTAPGLTSAGFSSVLSRPRGPPRRPARGSWPGAALCAAGRAARSVRPADAVSQSVRRSRAV